MNKLLFHFALPLAMLFALPLLSLSGVETKPAKKPLERLIEGNNRYVSSTTVCHEDWTAKRTALIENQKPYAVIVTCSDSRVPPEIVFDQTLGDLFIVRVAGNVVDDFAIGSIEYGVNVLGADLVLVLGHSNCGAVDAALKGMKFDNHIQEIINEMQPAIAATKGQTENLLEKTIKANVKVVVDELRTSKPLLTKLAKEGKLTVIGGYYDLATGKVEFLVN
jgi:carbonic anhydrase